jgi:hypothetical protein
MARCPHTKNNPQEAGVTKGFGCRRLNAIPQADAPIIQTRSVSKSCWNNAMTAQALPTLQIMLTRFGSKPLAHTLSTLPPNLFSSVLLLLLLLLELGGLLLS